MIVMPATLEICSRPRDLGQPCRGLIYRPQPDVVYCTQCGGDQPGVVYTLGAGAAQLKRLVDAGDLLLQARMGLSVGADIRPSFTDGLDAIGAALPEIRTMLGLKPPPPPEVKAPLKRRRARE